MYFIQCYPYSLKEDHMLPKRRNLNNNHNNNSLGRGNRAEDNKERPHTIDGKNTKKRASLVQ